MDSGHLDSQDIELAEGEGDSTDEEASDSDSSGSNAPDGAAKAQDLHSMLRVALKSLVNLQKTGFVWDLVCKNRKCKDLEFIPCISFAKCDTEEGRLLCGKYLARTKDVAHLCRYCHCPTDEADSPHAKYPYKTQPQIEKLVKNGDLDGLQRISQQMIKNAFYVVRFHQANARGIHGATPSEMLHALLLGIFKYLRDIFFDRSGKTTQLSEDIDALAKLYGERFGRQSERDLPQTNFNKGIRKGKLMAKQCRGVLLLLAAVLASTKGRQMLKNKKDFGGAQGLQDWTLLVELLLEWEAFLNQKQMRRSDVKRLKQKHRYIMYIMTIVAKRSTGMGLKLMKFHAILHLVEDILLYGVPTEFDTGSNESHHKPTKHAAKLTQRKEASFNLQTALRLLEFLAIDLAIQEIIFDKRSWDYYPDSDDEDTSSGSQNDDSGSSSNTDSDDKEVESEEELPVKVVNGGTGLAVFRGEEGEACFQVRGKSKHADNTSWDLDVIEFHLELQELVQDLLPNGKLEIFAEHTRDGTIFRGHPNYRGSGPWRDWVLVDWGDYGAKPCRIWSFVKLRHMPTGRDALEYGGIVLQDDVYAVVEYAEYEEQDKEREEQDKEREEELHTDLFRPLLLEMRVVGPETYKRQFYLASTQAFVEPIAVVPDIGGLRNRHVQCKPRREWSNLFVDWLRAPHKDDRMAFSDEEEEPEQ